MISRSAPVSRSVRDLNLPAGVLPAIIPSTLVKDPPVSSSSTLADHRAGATLPELCLAEEIAPQVVRRVLRAAGVDPGLTRPSAVDPAADASASDALADPDWLRAAYATKSGARVAEELGGSQYAVFEVLKQAGISRRSRRERGRLSKGIEPWPAELLECIAGLYLAGKTGEQVAHTLGLKPSAVYKQLREWGITRTISEGRQLKMEREAEKG